MQALPLEGNEFKHCMSLEGIEFMQALPIEGIEFKHCPLKELNSSTAP